jgi:hypothetical protein
MFSGEFSWQAGRLLLVLRLTSAAASVTGGGDGKLGQDGVQAESLPQPGQVDRLSPSIWGSKQSLSNMLNQELHLTWRYMTTTAAIVHVTDLTAGDQSLKANSLILTHHTVETVQVGRPVLWLG